MPLQARIGRLRFRAPWWALALTIFGLAAFAMLGVWQLHRGAEKEAMIAARHRAAKAHPVNLEHWLAQGKPASALYLKPVVLRGHYDSGRQLLLDNETWHQEPGFHVWTPFELAGSGRVVLVDRGWVAAGPTRKHPPNPGVTDKTLRVKGIMRDFPKPGLRLAKGGCRGGGTWPQVVEFPRYSDVSCLYPQRLVNGLVLLDPGEPHGFPRQWLKVGMSPQRHYAYAFQWFAMGLTALVMFLGINTRIEPRRDE